MRTKTSIACAVIAVILLGCSVFSKPKPVDPTPLSVEAFEEYQRLLKASGEQAKEIERLNKEISKLTKENTSLGYAFKTLEQESGTKISSLEGRLAELQKSNQPQASHPEDPIDADEYDAAQKKSSCAAGNCQPAAYQMRRGLFGRWRR